MSKKYILSVVMITYGHEDYISKAINSILDQECNYPFELIISNDNSPDNTDSIIREIIEKYNGNVNIQYIKHENNIGMMPNFLATIAIANSKYIALCEGDDYWIDSFKLQKQIDFLEVNPEYSGYAHQSTVLSKTNEMYPFNQHTLQEIKVDDLIGGRIFHTASILFRKEAVKLFTNAPIVFSGDRLLFLCIATLGKIFYSNQSMCVYRLHNSGASSTAKIKQIKLDLNGVDYLKKIYPKFHKYEYKSYVYATIGLCSNNNYFINLYYISLSFLYSFSYFPRNIIKILEYIKKRL